MSRTANLGGVFPDVLNELAVTGTSSPVSTNTGQALVYGVPYFNSTAVTTVIATPAALTRIDRIVLRASWAAQTVRITRIAGTEGAGAPAMTQTPGTTWDIPLATVSITTGGVITVTDAREWVVGVGDLTIDSTKLASNAVTTAKIADDNVTGAKIPDHAIDPRAHLGGQNGIVVDPANGNARGNDAVDLQTDRAAAGQVASGTNATIPGGKNNTASGDYSNASGFGAVASRYGEDAQAAGNFSAVGDAQMGNYVFRLSTSSASEVELFLDGSGQRITLAADQYMAFHALIVGYDTAATLGIAFEIKGAIGRQGGNTALIGTPTVTTLGDGGIGATAAVYADNTNDALVFKVDGPGNLTRWVGRVSTVEVK